jgi:hypothetical protein
MRSTQLHLECKPRSEHSGWSARTPPCCRPPPRGGQLPLGFYLLLCGTLPADGPRGGSMIVAAQPPTSVLPTSAVRINRLATGALPPTVGALRRDWSDSTPGDRHARSVQIDRRIRYDPFCWARRIVRSPSVSAMPARLSGSAPVSSTPSAEAATTPSLTVKGHRRYNALIHQSQPHGSETFCANRRTQLTSRWPSDRHSGMRSNRYSTRLLTWVFVSRMAIPAPPSIGRIGGTVGDRVDAHDLRRNLVLHMERIVSTPNTDREAATTGVAILHIVALTLRSMSRRVDPDRGRFPDPRSLHRGTQQPP